MLWAQPADAKTFRTRLNGLLDGLTQACWAYIDARAGSTREPFIRDLISREIPEERQRVAKLSAKANFAGLDRTKQVEEFKDAVSAQFGATGITVGETTVYDNDEQGMAECHSMSLWVDVDAGNRPAQPQHVQPNSIYGITLEYWENVEIAYNFKAANTDNAHAIAQKKLAGLGQTTKQWNDILALQPDSPTWTTLGGPIQKAWPTAVAEAANGSLRGKHKIGFTDNPGVTPKPGKYLSRILRFRIVIKGGGKQEEIYATQVFELDGTDKPVFKTYADSKGNRLGSARTQNAQTGQDEMTPMAQNDHRLQGHDVTPQVLAQSVPATARGAVRTFVRQLLGGNAAAFQDLEQNQLQQKFQGAADLSGPHKAYARMGPLKAGTINDYYAIAGMNMLPFPKPGWVYKEYAIPAGGLLVAIMQGAEIWRVYYTNNQQRAVGAQNVQVRSFAEIPIEEVTPYVTEQRALAGLAGGDLAAFNTVRQAAVTKQTNEAQAKPAMLTAFNNGDPATL